MASTRPSSARPSSAKSASKLLSPSQYDDDASSIHSERSDQDTDSEDDEVLMGARTSADIRAHDRSVLLEEEERDKLLEESRKRGRRGSAIKSLGKRLFSKSYGELPGVAGSEEALVGTDDVRSEKRRRRRQRRREKKERLMSQGEEGHLMYEMEEGGLKEGSGTGSSTETEGSDEIDRRGMKGLHEDKATRRRRWRMWCFIHLLIAVGFSILVLVAWKLSVKTKRVVKAQQALLSNGSALFAPTTILISLDGFRADFLKRGITPRLNAFIEEGVSPIYMNPSFPSVTFPNHYTLVTGLYPEAHGVVGNTFWDEKLREEFFYTNPNAMQPKWWSGEPIWVTAENQGIRSAIHMWPGSEAHIMDVEPTFLDKYNGKEPLPNKVTRVLGLLDKPGLEDKSVDINDMRPQLIAAYVPNVDADGHKYGPNSTEIRTTISDVDSMLNEIFIGIEVRNLTHIVNVVVVSDHGMATTDVNRLIQLEDLVDTSLIEHIDGWPLYGLRPKDPAQLQPIYDALKVKASSNPNIEVYLRDKDMPERYHFSKNERIAPLWIIPKTGWAIVTKQEFNVEDAKAKGIAYHPRGLHGYDHEHPLMRAIFIARGPAFPHAPNSRVEPFQNIEVYNIICDSLSLTPRPNNGTLRLPLQPVGLHDSSSSPSEPADPPAPYDHTSSQLPGPKVTPSVAFLPPVAATPTEATPEGPLSIYPIESASPSEPAPENLSPELSPVEPPEKGEGDEDEVSVERPVATDESGMTEEEKDFWEWITEKLDGVKGWWGELISSGKGNETGEESEESN